MPFVATPKFPAAVMGIADIGNLKDYITGTTKPTLAGSLTNVATSFSVATGTGATLPADNFTVTIDSEEMFVTTRSTDALSGITRGVNGTSAASHLSAAPVNHFIIAGIINQLAAEVNAIETWNAALAGTIGVTVDGGGSVPPTGSKGFIQAQFDGTITGWTVIANASGSAQFTIKKCNYATFPTTASIVASAPVTLTSAQKNTSTTLTGWTTSISKGDIIEFNLDSVSTVTRLTLNLKITRLD